jgi:hypothetical protein
MSSLFRSRNASRDLPTENEETPFLLAAIALAGTWALTSAALNLPDFCRSESLLQCSSSNYNNVHPWLTALLLIGLIDAFLVLRAVRFGGWCTLLYVVLVGVANRLIRDSMLYVSDVIDATREALGVLFSGHNPYLHIFVTTRPPYSPFPYLPGELLFYGIPYALFHSIDAYDRIVGIATVFLIAALAPIIGTGRASLFTALYATFGLAASTAVDGTNDGSLAFLLVAAGVSLAWSEFARTRILPPWVASGCFFVGSAFFAWALLFKALSWPFLPFVAAYLFRTDPAAARRYLLTIGIFCVAAAAPFLLSSPGGFIINVYNGFAFHAYSFYGMNVWTGLLNSGVSVNPRSTIVSYWYVALVLCLFVELLLSPSRSLGGAFLRGTAVIVTALLLAHFSTSSYYTFAGTMFIAALGLMPVVRREESIL